MYMLLLAFKGNVFRLVPVKQTKSKPVNERRKIKKNNTSKYIMDQNYCEIKFIKKVSLVCV